MKHLLKTLLVGILCGGAGAAAVHLLSAAPRNRELPPGQPFVAEGYEVQTLARTAEGASVYRLAGPKIVVPAVVVVGRDGSVVVR